MKLLEREQCLVTLSDTLAEATAGRGQVVLISGEAGVGKTSVVEYFAQAHRQKVRFLRGTCDPLFTPHPLCPLHDIARQLPDSELADLLWGTDRLRVFDTFLRELQTSHVPTVVIFEDIHWADEATLDLIRFLGRRFQDTSSMMIITYRDDELAADHPLWLVLGHLSGSWVHRIRLQPLSKQAVIALAEQAGHFIENLYEITDGNPFFVTEMLAASHEGVPHSIREAVLARAKQLPPEARSFVEMASVVPKERFERWLYERMSNPLPGVLEACVSSGLVRFESDAVIFRHELARQAIAESLHATRWQELNAVALRALLARLEEGAHVSCAHIVHHAHQARNSEVVLRFVASAAQEASALGAHREAVVHYRTGLKHADRLSWDAQASLLENLAYECYLTGRIDDAVHYRSQALDVWRAHHRQEKVGENLRWLSRLNWFLGNRSVADHYAVEAVEILEGLPPGLELAMAYSNRAQLAMLSNHAAGAVYWGRQAIELAQQFESTETLVHAMNNVGAAQWFTDREAAERHLKESLRLALEHNLEEHAARAYTNLGCMAVVGRQYDLAEVYLDEGIGYSINHDLDSWSYYMQGWRARLYLEQGNWDQATREATGVMRSYSGTATMIRIPALEVLVRLRTRRGDPRAEELLVEVCELAQQAQDLLWIVPVTVAKIEMAWLQDRLDQVVHELHVLRQREADPWTRGLLALWLWRAGELSDRPDDIALPFHLEISHHWRAAADEWARIGCPYEQALALMQGDDEAQKTALQILEQLGAAPVVDLLRRKMRQEGVKGIARGPRRETQENPAGLTQRQKEVLELLIHGLSDSEIADRLYISSKTAGHHVSAILSKLDVRSRQEAAVLAVRRGWFEQNPTEILPNQNREPSALT